MRLVHPYNPSLNDPASAADIALNININNDAAGITRLTSPDDWDWLDYTIVRPESGVIRPTSHSRNSEVSLQLVSKTQPQELQDLIAPLDDIPYENHIQNMRLVINNIDSLIQNLSNTEFKTPQNAPNEKVDLHNKLLASSDSIINAVITGNAQSAIDELQKNVIPDVVSKLVPQAQDKVVLNIDNLIKAIQDLAVITSADMAEEQRLIELIPPSQDKGVVLSAEDLRLLNATHAETATLGEPYFVERGKITGQKDLGPNRTQFTYAANGKMNGNIEVTDTGEFVSISKGDNLSTTKDGVITTKDGSETANYTSIDVGNFTDYQGASAYSTNSTGKLSFLNNMLGIYKGETGESGDFVLREWHWE